MPKKTCPRVVVPKTCIPECHTPPCESNKFTFKPEYLNQLLNPYELHCIMKIPNSNEVKPLRLLVARTTLLSFSYYLISKTQLPHYPMIVHYSCANNAYSLIA